MHASTRGIRHSSTEPKQQHRAGKQGGPLTSAGRWRRRRAWSAVYPQQSQQVSEQLWSNVGAEMLGAALSPGASASTCKGPPPRPQQPPSAPSDPAMNKCRHTPIQPLRSGQAQLTHTLKMQHLTLTRITARGSHDGRAWRALGLAVARAGGYAADVQPHKLHQLSQLDQLDHSHHMRAPVKREAADG